ncbi:hypothetical protein SAMCCGM7_pB0287 (plasmid) [Sinorhizobium americanum CCGM7]|nr:hypothetical protein [Sinorhizobium americanum]APG87002.1 hypothetical protein SAMCCGM7_pB0287 [Sinorhizobium americanum CCGM7]
MTITGDEIAWAVYVELDRAAVTANPAGDLTLLLPVDLEHVTP